MNMKAKCENFLYIVLVDRFWAHLSLSSIYVELRIQLVARSKCLVSGLISKVTMGLL